ESDMVVLAPKVSGQIVEMLVADSEHVGKGQLLFRIDPVPYREQIALDLANEKKAGADLEVARSALARLAGRIPDQIALAQRQLAAATTNCSSRRVSLNTHGLPWSTTWLRQSKTFALGKPNATWPSSHTSASMSCSPRAWLPARCATRRR